MAAPVGKSKRYAAYNPIMLETVAVVQPMASNAASFRAKGAARILGPGIDPAPAAGELEAL